MKPLLIVEIVSALVALAALVWLVWYLACSKRRRAGKAACGASLSTHVKVSMALCGAAVVHGISAVAYASGALTATYVLGAAGLACFVLSGMCMAGPVRGRLKNPARLHMGLFVGGLMLVVAHMVVGRL